MSLRACAWENKNYKENRHIAMYVCSQNNFLRLFLFIFWFVFSPFSIFLFFCTKHQSVKLRMSNKGPKYIQLQD